MAIVKKCSARVNLGLGVLDGRLAEVIIAAADEILAGKHLDNFLLVCGKLCCVCACLSCCSNTHTHTPVCALALGSSGVTGFACVSC